MYSSIPRSTLYVVVSVLFLIKSSIPAASLGPGEVNTTYGPVRGKTVNLPAGKQILQFLGIPYGYARRFEKPQSPSSWNVTFDAKKHGKSCPQIANVPPFNVASNDMGEDCLNLNVFTPNTTAFREQSATNPVLVWLHGGAYIIGSSTITDPSTIATRGNIVVVTVNYRLGALGFLSLKEEGLTGNYALFDVIKALQWVQNNIQSFGGDPSKVTLGGWSAGARLVGVLMLSPYASGLYERVLMMSGAAGGLSSYLHQEEADFKALYFGGLLRCPHPSSDFKDCLKRKSPAQFIGAQSKTHPSILLPQWAPVVDGDVLPDSPPKLLDQGKFNGSSVLTGVANGDGSAFLNNIPGLNKGVDVTKGMSREAFEQAIGNKTWTEYREFDKDIDGKPIPKWMNITHRADLSYIFPNPTQSSMSPFTETMMELWISYLKTGKPSSSWLPYTVTDQKYQALRSFPTPESKLRIEKMKFWNEFLPKYGMAEERTPAPTTSPTNDSDDLTIALIVVSFFLGIFFILVLIFIIVLYGRKKESSPPPPAFKPPPKEPLPRREEPKYYSTPHTPSPPYESPGPNQYENSFTYAEKGHSYPPPSPAYKGDYYDGKIDIVEERGSPHKVFMDSDML